MRREATTSTQPRRPRTGQRASDEVAATTAHLEALPEAVDVFDAFQAASHLNNAADTPRRLEHARPPRPADDTRKGKMHQWLRTGRLAIRESSQRKRPRRGPPPANYPQHQRMLFEALLHQSCNKAPWGRRSRGTDYPRLSRSLDSRYHFEYAYLEKLL